MHDTKPDQLNKARVKGYSKYCQGQAFFFFFFFLGGMDIHYTSATIASQGGLYLPSFGRSFASLNRLARRLLR